LSTHDILVLVFGSVYTLIFLLMIVFGLGVYIWHDYVQKRHRALLFLSRLLTDEFFIRARLVSAQYLLADPHNPKYAAFAGKNFEEIDRQLRQSPDADDREARFLIRALPDFFHAVNTARAHGYLRRRERVFSKLYAWYWVNILEDRTIGIADHMGVFREYKWMRTELDVDMARRAKGERLRAAGLTNDGQAPSGD
jgi:hypothetical protein